MTTQELALVEFLAQIAETTSHTFESLLIQFPANEKLQNEFNKFYEKLMLTFGEVL